MEITDTVKQIKQSFRLVMNGPAAASMREKGINYKLNWGVPYIELKKMAEQYGKSAELAIALWKEDIRECKILATLIMPVSEFKEDIASVWIEQVTTQEIAEMLASNLISKEPYALRLAYQWLATTQSYYEICGYNIMSRLFMKGEAPGEADINEFIDQAITDISGKSTAIAHAAFNAVNKFCDLGEVYYRIARSAMRKIGIEL